MLCPLRKITRITRSGEATETIIEDFAECLQEKCSWWEQPGDTNPEGRCVVWTLDEDIWRLSETIKWKGFE
jgi:hypothetical protein